MNTISSNRPTGDCICDYGAQHGENKCELFGFLNSMRAEEGGKNDTNNKYFFRFNDKTYCIFHAPHQLKERWGENEIDLFVDTLRKMGHRHVDHIDGAIFTGLFSKAKSVDYILDKDTVFTNCTFHLGAVLSGHNAVSMHIERSTFNDWYNYNYNSMNERDPQKYFGDITNLVLSSCNFKCSVNISTVSESLAIRNTEIAVPFSLNCRKLSKLELQNVRINSKFSITGNEIPADSMFSKVSFGQKAISPSLAPQYRYLKNACSDHQSRFDEGKFYAMEQRCKRMEYQKWHYARWLSWLYDIVSEYGMSYERLITISFFMPFIFALLYLFLFYLNSPSCTLYLQSDKCVNYWESLNFSLLQIFKPFELITIKQLNIELEFLTNNGITKKVLLGSWIPFWTVVQSLLSYSLLALLFLALRWRFKRG